MVDILRTTMPSNRIVSIDIDALTGKTLRLTI
jgi:hypothetical protein